MHRSITSVASAVLCTGWMIFVAQPAAAQGQPPTQRPPTQGVSRTPNVSEQKLDQTAAAIQHVQTVRNNYAEKLSAASPDEKSKILTEANAAMQKAVTDQGLSVDEYNSIVQLAQNDPSVRERIVKRLGAAEK